MSAANDDVMPDAVPSACCGSCGHWAERTYSGRQYPPLGVCYVRSGFVPVFTPPAHGCDVAQGQAWIPITVLA